MLHLAQGDGQLFARRSRSIRPRSSITFRQTKVRAGVSGWPEDLATPRAMRSGLS